MFTAQDRNSPHLLYNATFPKIGPIMLISHTVVSITIALNITLYFVTSKSRIGPQQLQDTVCNMVLAIWLQISVHLLHS